MWKLEVTLSDSYLEYYHHQSYQKVFISIGKYQDQGSRNKCPKNSKICTWKLEFNQWQWILSVAFLEVTGVLYSFSRKCQLSHTHAFPWDHLHTPVCSQGALYKLPIILLKYITTQNIKKTCIQGSRFHKTNGFYCFIMTFLNEQAFLQCEYEAVKTGIGLSW